MDGIDVRQAEPVLAARADRQSHPGNHPLQRHGAQQHRLRPARRCLLAGGGSRESGPGPRLYRAHAGRLRHRHRREGIPPLRWRAAAAGDRPRHPEERSCTDPRRGHLRPRRGKRIPGAGRAGQSDGRAHRHRHRAPPLHRAPRQSHRCARARPHHGHRHPRRAAANLAYLPEALPPAVHGYRRRQWQRQEHGKGNGRSSPCSDASHR